MEKPDMQFESSQQTEIIKKKSWYRRWWAIVLFIFILLFLTWFVISVHLAYKNSQNRGLNINSTNQLPENNIANLYTEDDPSLGKPEAGLWIVEFSDFQCPYCQQAASIMRELVEKYPDKIYYIYRDFPIDSIHPQAQLAAEAAACAQRQGKFWPYHDLLFANQSNLQLASLLAYAAQVEIQLDDFSKCLSDGVTTEEVMNDLQEGIEAGVTATPTFFINGYKTEGVIPLDSWEKIIDQLK